MKTRYRAILNTSHLYCVPKSSLTNFSELFVFIVFFTIREYQLLMFTRKVWHRGETWRRFRTGRTSYLLHIAGNVQYFMTFRSC